MFSLDYGNAVRDANRMGWLIKLMNGHIAETDLKALSFRIVFGLSVDKSNVSVKLF